MKLSFCITTDLKNPDYIDKSIRSIHKLNAEDYEILVISESMFEFEGARSIFFDEDPSRGLITKKKNILAREAKYKNIVMMHDYFLFDENWYSNFVDFGEDWDVCSNSQLLLDGRRHWLDWTVWDDPIYERYTGLCYDEWDRTDYMYISGAFYLVKKDFAISNPLDENLMWGQSEDVEWSIRIRKKAKIKCNGKSIINHCKDHRDLKYFHFKINECK